MYVNTVDFRPVLVRMREFWHDFRLAFRLIRRAPAMAAVVIGSLAVGIGANTTVFSFVNALQFKPLPVVDETTLVTISEWSATDVCAGCGVGTSLPSLLEWRARATAFSAMGAYKEDSFVLSDVSGAGRVGGALVSSNLFGIVGVQSVLGRGLTEGDELPGATPVVLLSDRLRRHRFASQSEVVGSTVKVDGVMRTIVGVMPPGFSFPEFAQLWIPLRMDGSAWPRTDRSLGVLARLRRGMTLDQARAEMRTLAAAQALAHPQSNIGWTAQVTSLREDMTGETAMASTVFLAAVGFLLMIACANVANLLLARAVERRREIAIRIALGANRKRIARLVWTESLALSVTGGMLGMVGAMWASRWVVASFAVETPYWIQFGMDWRVPLFCAGVTFITALMCGFAPAVHASRRDVRSTLQDGITTTGGAKSRRFRHALVVVQLSLALVLLAGAGLMIRAVIRIYQFEIGYDPSRVLAGNITLIGPRYASPSAIRAFTTSLLESLERIPSVHVAVSRTIFFAGFGGQPRQVMVDGMVEVPPGASPGFYYAVTPGYFTALGIAILDGRDFDVGDHGDVAIVNREMANRIWGSNSPLGARIRFDSTSPWLTVVGVVANAGGSPMAAGRRAAFAYLPFAGNEGTSLSVSLRAPGDVMALAPEVRAAVTRLDSDVPIEDLMTVATMMEQWAAPVRFVALMMSGLSAVALFLAALGTYGVMAYGVAQRTREIGIRIALGATSRHVQQLLVGSGFRLVLWGLGIGVIAAWMSTRVLTGILAGTSPTDPIVFITVASTLGMVGLAASWIPSRRALKVDPTIALRAE